jgi:hypothetical protein
MLIKMYNKWNTNRYSTWNYKKAKFIKYSAGVLPYTFDHYGKCLFLLGKDNEGCWSDFGGRCEFKDNGDEKITATREFYEETLGSVMNIKECIDKINVNPIKIVSRTLNGSPYYMYLVYIDYYNYTDSFYKTSNFIRYTHSQDKRIIYKLIEKNTIRWIHMDTILNCLENKEVIPLRGVFYKTIENCKDQLHFLQQK